LKRCGIKWDKMGKSTGHADVEYENPKDARKAISDFNGILRLPPRFFLKEVSSTDRN